MEEIVTRIVYLIKRFLTDELDDGEKQELESWLLQSEGNRRLFEQLTNSDYLFKAVNDSYSEERVIKKIQSQIEDEQQDTVKLVQFRRFTWRRMIPAAVILFAVALGAIYVFNKDERHREDSATNISAAKQDIEPGTSKATLKLADGSTIVLDSSAMGQLAQQGSMQVVNKNGELVYAPAGRQGKVTVLYNTVTTSNGQTYPVTLSDNSRIWLNAASSVRFPVVFAGHERKVEVTGEVYFEIAHDAAKPFIVSVNGVDIKVLGTKFNVNAYSDEAAIKTTLVEGAVRVSKGMQQKQLVPGQQAQVYGNEIRITDKVEIDKIIAWKKGLFAFRSDNLTHAMKEIARWYNVDVVYEGNAGHVEISGNIFRNSNLSEVLKILSTLDVASRIEGRKLILSAQ